MPVQADATGVFWKGLDLSSCPNCRWSVAVPESCAFVSEPDEASSLVVTSTAHRQ